MVITLGSRSDDRPRTVLYTVAATAALSMIVEAGQWMLPRTVSPQDLMLNTLGAGFGAGVAILVKEREWPNDKLMTSIAALVLLCVAVYLAYGAVSATQGFRLAGWNPGYLLIQGDEADGTRPYQGLVDKAQSCAGRPPELTCVAAAAERPARHRLTEIAERSQRIEMSATVNSAHDGQRGPTRIISFSRGPWVRNATLGQEGRALIFRVRTPVTGDNGSDPQFALPEAVFSGVPSKVMAEFDQGTIRISAQSGDQQAVATFQFGLFTGWLTTFPIRTLEPPHFSRGTVAACLALFVGLGIFIGRLWRHGWFVSAACVSLFGLALFAFSWGANLFAHPVEPAFAAGFLLLGVLLSVLDQKNRGDG